MNEIIGKCPEVITKENPCESKANFEDFENSEIDRVESQERIYYVDGKFSFKKWLATKIVTLGVNFTTKKAWTFSLFFYLLLVVPIGTYQVIKFIINIF